MARARKAPVPPPRRRRTAEEARAAILDAAERRLVASGAGGIRLQEVAAEVGVSHPTVLHHFGSREALVEAVVERALDSLQGDLMKALGGAPESEGEVASLLDRIHDALTSRGQGRALLWLALAGHVPRQEDLRLRELAEALHGLRAVHAEERDAPFEDTQFVVALVASALIAQSVIGPNLLRGAGVGDAKAGQRFRAWMARLLIDHVEGRGAQ